jgi:hypothetical protein
LAVGCRSNSVKYSDEASPENQKLSMKDTSIFNLDTIRPLNLPLLINIYSFCEDSIIGKKAEMVKRKVLNGYKVFGKMYTKLNQSGIITTESDNTICLNICNNEGKLISKTAITPLIEIPPTHFLIGKYFMITQGLEIESGIITGDCAIDKDSLFLATLITEAKIEKFKIDSNGFLIKINVTPNNIMLKTSLSHRLQ